MAVPNRPNEPYAYRHKDFICIAAANTVGLGADRQFSGRNKLDAATLDRFAIGKIMMDYDPEVEMQLCPDPLLYGLLTRIRTNIRNAKLERAMSTRFMIDAYEMKQLGWSDEQILTSYFEGWRQSEITKARA